MAEPTVYRVNAHNYAHDSENKIHRDDVAAEYGFKGGLVPGVADFAYLIQAVVARWGKPWLTEGEIEASLLKPLYHGELATATARQAAGTVDADALELTLTNPEGVVCARGRALRAHRARAPRLDDFPRASQAGEADRRPPSPEGFPAGHQLAVYQYECSAQALAAEAESMFVDGMPALDGGPRWHPALALHDANRALRANLSLGPWIHTASRLQLFGAPSATDTVALRGTVIDTYEKRGHVMTDVDLGVFSRTGHPIARVKHSAIIRLRARSEAA